VGVADLIRAPFLAPAPSGFRPLRESNTGRIFLCSAGSNFVKFFSRTEILTTPFCTHSRSKDSELDLVSDFEDVKDPTRVSPKLFNIVRPFEVVSVEGVGKYDTRLARTAMMSGSPAAYFMTKKKRL
jgi:hypothetical protein